MTLKAPLSTREVDDLFSGKPLAPFPPREACDNCHIVTDDVLVFGECDEFALTPAAGSPLEIELAILTRRENRRRIVLCYTCTDILEEPVARAHRKRVVVPKRAPTVVPNEAPRLFEV